MGNREEKGNKMVTEDRLLCVPPRDCPLPAEGMFTEQLLCAPGQRGGRWKLHADTA